MSEIKKSYDLKKKKKHGAAKSQRSSEGVTLCRGHCRLTGSVSKSQLRGPMGKVKNTGSAVTLNRALKFEIPL